MSTVSTTARKARTGVEVSTKNMTIIEVEECFIELLVGGLYVKNFREHTYGHAFHVDRKPGKPII